MAGVVVVVVVDDDDDDDDGHRHFSKICLHDPSHQVRRVQPLIQHHQVSHDHQTRDTAVNFRHKFSAKNCHFWIVGSLPANNGCLGKPRRVPAPPNGSGGDGMAVAGGSKMEQIENMRKMDKKWWIWLVLVLSYFLILLFLGGIG